MEGRGDTKVSLAVTQGFLDKVTLDVTGSEETQIQTLEGSTKQGPHCPSPNGPI